jgi:hypothetical protein
LFRLKAKFGELGFRAVARADAGMLRGAGETEEETGAEPLRQAAETDMAGDGRNQGGSERIGPS